MKRLSKFVDRTRSVHDQAIGNCNAGKARAIQLREYHEAHLRNQEQADVRPPIEPQRKNKRKYTKNTR